MEWIAVFCTVTTIVIVMQFEYSTAHSVDYDYTKSTEDNYCDESAPLVGEYKDLRKGQDYTYHKHYSESRQLFQDKIITRLCKAVIYDDEGMICDRPKENWIVFTAGAMGSGSHSRINTTSIVT